MKKSKKGCVLLLLLVALVSFASSIIFYSCKANRLPAQLRKYTDLSFVKLPEKSNPSRIYAADGAELGQVSAGDRVFVALPDMPSHLPEAFIAIEDERFYKHHGIDTRGVLRALWRSVAARRAKQGASTITMQLARNLYLSREKTFSRKTMEALISAELENKYSKDEILEAYLNLIYFGHGAYGVGAAADLYFGKFVKNLTPAESAVLAAVVKGPALYSPFINREASFKRRNLVLGKMKELGFIDDNEYARAVASPLRLIPYKGRYSNYRAPYFVDYVIHQLTRENGDFRFSARELATGGYRIFTTLDPEMQRDAEAAVIGGVAAANLRLASRRPADVDAVLNYALSSDVRILGMDPDTAYQQFGGRHITRGAIRRAREMAAAIGLVRQGAFVALDVDTGAVRAMVGGVNFSKSGYNRAWLAERQAGSSFKPFVYLTALSQGHSMGDTVENSRYCIGNYCPKNYGGDHGNGASVTYHEALMLSLNIPAVRVGHEAGEENIIRLCRKLGITADLTPTPSLSLGAAEISPLQMAAAYSAMANGGYEISPFAIKEIRDDSGQVLYKSKPRHGGRALPGGAVRGIVPALQDVILRGTGTAARFGRPEAGKTGTTSSSRDAWFVGFTPSMAAAVWIGNDDNKPLCGPRGNCITGGRVPAPIWRDVMKRVSSGSRQFNLPDEPLPEIQNPDEQTGEDLFGNESATSSEGVEMQLTPENPDGTSGEPNNTDDTNSGDSLFPDEGRNETATETQ